MTRQKTILINTDYLAVRSGLGRDGKELALYLHKTGKYKIVYYACGMLYESLDYERYPFKVCGTLPNNPVELDQINKDPGYARACAYGLYNIDKVVKEFKPDILIASNDSWAMDSYISHPFWNKIHCIPHVTMDSLPFISSQIDLIKKSKHLFVWAEFAEREARRLGFDNVSTLTGMINQKSFYKLHKHEKLDLRKKYNIPQNAFITGFVFRNQIRKEVGALIEGYAQFKRDNPEIKNTYLLFHTFWGEGWDIHKFCSDFSVPKEEVLTTYICKNCGEIEVKAFVGHDINCRFCAADKSQVTCGVGLGCSEEQLNQVYNLMDCYCHLANASGLEIPVVEALYAEMPVAVNPYAALETFGEQDFVTNIDFAWTVQHGTQFKRSIPYPSSVAKFLKKIYYTPKEKREEIGKKGRNWAINKFSPEVVGKQWEDYIDSLPDINWDYNFAPEPKNPSYSMPEIQDDAEWVIDLYKNILHMNVDTQDSGFTNWMTQLKRGVSRQDIYKFFINVAMDENAKNAPKVDYSSQLINNGKKHFLIVLKESIGDIIMSSSLLSSFRKNYPSDSWNLYYATSPQYRELLEGNPNIDKILDFQQFMDSEIHCIGAGKAKGYFDGYAHLGVPTQKFLNYLSNTNINLPNKVLL